MTRYHWFFSFLFVLGLSWVVIHNYYLRQKIGDMDGAISLLREQIHKGKMIRLSAETLQMEMGWVKGQLSETRNKFPYEFNEFLFLADVKAYASNNRVELLEYVRGEAQFHEEMVEHTFAIKARGSYHDFGYLFAQIANDQHLVKVRALHLLNAAHMKKAGVMGWFVTSFFSYREPTREKALAQMEKEENSRKARRKRKRKGN